MVQTERAIKVYYGKDVDITNPNLIKLISEGYKFNTSILNENFISWRLKVEYHFAEIVYVVKSDNFEVASLSVNTRPNTLTDPFWKDLQTRRPNISDPDLLAIYMQGIVVHPSYQNHGIASQLLRAMVDYYNPSVILGQTKTPEAVGTRSKVLAELAYRSFYGFSEVTPGCDYKKEGEGLDFIRAAFASEHFASRQTLSERGIYFVDPDILPSYMPDTMYVAPEIKRAFAPVIEAQDAVGHLKTAASVLVSVKDSLIASLSG